MKTGRDILPEHIPGGEKLTKEDLAPINRKRSHPVVKLATVIAAALAVGILPPLLLSRLAGGFAGNALAAVFAALSPAVVVSFLGLTSRSSNREYSKLGLDRNARRAAAANFADDRRAWGEPVSQTVYYRIKCRKCKKISPWKDLTLTSCTDETLSEKIADFKNKTLKKRKDFQSGAGFARYSLDRVCPECGVKQKKHPPRWYSIPIITVVWFFVFTIAWTVVIAPYHKSEYYTSMNDIGMAASFITAFVLAVVALYRYMSRRKNSPVQFAFSEDEKNVPFPAAQKTNLPWRLTQLLNAAAFLLMIASSVSIAYDFLRSDHQGANIVQIIASCAAQIIFGAAGLLFVFRKNRIYPVFPVLEYAAFLAAFAVKPDHFNYQSGLVTVALLVFVPAIIAVPFVFFRRGDKAEDAGENGRPGPSEK